jgi:hypothetical protein
VHGAILVPREEGCKVQEGSKISGYEIDNDLPQFAELP